jgi:hypothetical protein
MGLQFYHSRFYYVAPTMSFLYGQAELDDFVVYFSVEEKKSVRNVALPYEISLIYSIIVQDVSN